MTTPELRVNENRLNRRIAELAEFGKTQNGGVSRVAFSDADVEARRYVMNLMQHAGLNVRVDPVGNIFGRKEGTAASEGAILFGSHIDTVPDGGAYDGALGSLAAIEVAHTLGAAGYRNKHPLEVAIWSDEEGGVTGSSGFLGELTGEDLERRGHDGVCLADKIRRIGGDPASIEESRPEPGSVAAYVELHVEQGSVLESEGIDVGIVEGIVGIDHHDVVVEGTANHAGTTPMGRRHNALLTASELVLSVDRIVRSIGGCQVGTIGRLLVEPCAPNVIPGRVELTVELRDVDESRLESAWTRIAGELEEISTKYGTSVHYGLRQSLEGALLDPGVCDAIEAVAGRLGLSSKRMPSGAGHDAQKLAALCPSGMIFVPSAEGISHSPKELTTPEDVENGANMLLHTVLELDGR